MRIQLITSNPNNKEKDENGERWIYKEEKIELSKP